MEDKKLWVIFYLLTHSDLALHDYAVHQLN